MPFPQVDNACRLYAIHRARTRRRAGKSLLADDPVAYLLAFETRSIQNGIARRLRRQPGRRT